MIEFLNRTDIVISKDNYYKPIITQGLNKIFNVYFIDICSGEMLSFTPYRIEQRQYLTVSELADIFNDNQVKILHEHCYHIKKV